MTARIVKVALWLAVLTLLPGCVEMTQTITLNPDGRGKMTVEILVAAYNDLEFGQIPGAPGAAKKPKSLDEIRNDAAAKFVRDAAGVTAFKDVSVKWARDGRLHMVATAYFDKLEDLDKADNAPKDPTNIQPASNFRNSFQFTKNKDGTIRITAKNQGVNEGIKPLEGQDPPPDLSKATDKEIDEYLLRMRVEFQKVRPLLELMFNELKVKTVLKLPGDIVEAKGFKKESRRTVSQSFEGAAIMALFKKFLMMDVADVRKLAEAKNEKDIKALIGPLAVFAEQPDVTINNLGGPQFDYDREVREARAAYPMLRKALALDDGVKLPGE